jgi:hypothetical protein
VFINAVEAGRWVEKEGGTDGERGHYLRDRRDLTRGERKANRLDLSRFMPL